MTNEDDWCGDWQGIVPSIETEREWRTLDKVEGPCKIVGYVRWSPDEEQPAEVQERAVETKILRNGDRRQVLFIFDCHVHNLSYKEQFPGEHVVVPEGGYVEMISDAPGNGKLATSYAEMNALKERLGILR